MQSQFSTKQVFEQRLSVRRQAIVLALARRLYRELSEHSLERSSVSSQNRWVEIESLSQLRGIVGGRFQTVKNHWTAAGFPLRAHRGDRSEDAEFNKEGWLQLVVWLDSQGFQARRKESDSSVCFEIQQK